MEKKYNRVLLKLSGEALSGSKGFGLESDEIKRICDGIRKAHALGCQIAIVVGGGNFWRGRSGAEIERTRSDHIGMLATVMNSLAVADMLEKLGLDVRVQTALSIQSMAEPYSSRETIRHLEQGRIVMLACGTGNPFFSTDSAAALRAAEIKADMVFKATMVDGVYDKDPKKYADAVKYDKVSFTEVLNKDLKVIDSTAAALCRDNSIPLLVFSLENADNIAGAVCGAPVGTIVEE